MKALLSDAIDDYAKWRTGQYAKSTLANDKTVLKSLLTSSGNVYVQNVSEHHMLAFFAARSHRAAASKCLDHTVLNAFFGWCRKTRRAPLDFDPMFGRRRPAVAQRERLRVPQNRFPALLDLAGASCARDRAIVATGLFAMLRDGEMRSLRIRDLDLDAQQMFVRIHKTNEEDYLPVSGALEAELRKWLTIYATEAGGLDPDWYLFPTRGRSVERAASGEFVSSGWLNLIPTKPMSKMAVIVTPLLKSAGYDTDGTREGAHTLRRSGARALFDILVEQGFDYALRTVQTMLHHKDMAMTQHYIGITADRRTRDDLLKTAVRYSFEASAVVTPLREAQ